MWENGLVVEGHISFTSQFVYLKLSYEEWHRTRAVTHADSDETTTARYTFRYRREYQLYEWYVRPAHILNITIVH